MKVIVDFELCEANAICVRVAPEVFKLDDEDKLHILNEDPGEELREKLKIAERRCPRRAIKIVD